MTVKLTYFFRDITSSTDDGWTENFYVGLNSASQALEVATEPGWLNERLAFLAQTYMLSGIRAQNVANRFDNARARFNQATGVGQYPVGGRNQAEGEAPWTGVLLRLFAGSVSARSMTVRGIASNVIGQNLEYQPPALFRTRFDTWRDDLSVAPNAYQLRHMTILAPVASPIAVTVTADKRALQLTYTATLAPAALSPGSTIQMYGIQSAAPVSGLWRVQANDGTIVSLFPRRRTIYGNPTVPTLINKMQFTFSAITDTEVIRGAERKAGRPSDALRGRSRARTV